MRTTILLIGLLWSCDQSAPTAAIQDANPPASRPALEPAPAAASVTTVPLCEPDEPGERLRFEGRVLDARGRPYAKAAVVAYNTDRDGLYVPRGSATRAPRIRGVAVTDDDGWFRFSTIKPGSYPSEREPAHIHVTVCAPGHHVRDIAIWFEGDPFITPERRRDAEGKPNHAITLPAKDADGVTVIRHDISLSEN